jgi:hypothetical protein
MVINGEWKFLIQWFYMAPPNHPMVIKWQTLDETNKVKAWWIPVNKWV